MPTQLELLREYTTVVADTGDFEALRELRPTDATTNPSLILKAVQQDAYRPLVEATVASNPRAPLSELVDRLLVAFGAQILDIIPGRVSTEVDARLSFDIQGTIQRARQLTELYRLAGIARERVLIKIAATWEGIQAARALQAEGIACNLTLLFSMHQAVACAEAKVQLISPFVGRIYDWHKKAAGDQWDEAANAGLQDPGVKSVSQIYHYYKAHGIPTEIMGASFRNIGQIQALAGCDLLTISPELLRQLGSNTDALDRQLDPRSAAQNPPSRLAVDEISFRTGLNLNAMASDKLSEGIRVFVADATKLDEIVEKARQT